MKRHVLHPLWVTIALVVLVLLARVFLVPDDFGVHGRNFTYGFHRLSNISEWQAFPVKYLGEETCIECHDEKVQANNSNVHKNIQCENCHGAATGHPDEQEALPIDESRELCLRCHQQLEYPHGARSAVVAVDGDKHRRRRSCSRCHDPHEPREEES